MTTPRAVLLLVALAGAAPARAEITKPDEVGVRVNKLLGKEVIKLLLGSTRAEIYRLEDPLGREDRNEGPRPGAELVSGYVALGPAQPLEDAVRVGFREALLHSETYTFFDLPPNTFRGKGCGGFRPGVAVRFWSASDKKKYLDALLCFHCADIALVPSGTRKEVLHDMSSGETELLRLAAVGLPQDRELARLLASSQEREAREALFMATLPPRFQLAQRDLRGRGEERIADEFRQDLPGSRAFVVAAQALGARRNDWLSHEPATDALVRAVRGLPPETIAEGLAAIANDQSALAGACELLDRGALAGVPRAAIDPWRPRLVEAAVILLPRADLYAQMRSLAALPGKAGYPLLGRVASGALPAAGAARPHPYTLSARASALLALAAPDPQAARGAAKGWVPSDPVDAAAVKAVGNAGAPDPSLFEAKAPDLGVFLVEAIRTRPTQAGLDLLVARGIGHPYRTVHDIAEAAFTALTGFKFETSDDRDAHAAAARAWWRDHRATWQAP